MNYHYFNGLLALIVLVFAIFGWSKVVVILGAALLLLHSLMNFGGSCCPCCDVEAKPTKKPVKKKK